MRALFIAFLLEFNLYEKVTNLVWNTHKETLIEYIESMGAVDYIYGICDWEITEEGHDYWQTVKEQWIKYQKEQA